MGFAWKWRSSQLNITSLELYPGLLQPMEIGQNWSIMIIRFSYNCKMWLEKRHEWKEPRSGAESAGCHLPSFLLDVWCWASPSTSGGLLSSSGNWAWLSLYIFHIIYRAVLRLEWDHLYPYHKNLFLPPFSIWLLAPLAAQPKKVSSLSLSSLILWILLPSCLKSSSFVPLPYLGLIAS